MTITEHDCVVLTADLPGERLKAGDVGTVVHIHNGGMAYEVEFMTFAGNTIALQPSMRRLYALSVNEISVTCANCNQRASAGSDLDRQSRSPQSGLGSPLRDHALNFLDWPHSTFFDIGQPAGQRFIQFLRLVRS